MNESFLMTKNGNHVHISGVRPFVSGRSTDTRPGESSRRVCTTVCLLRRAAAPRGLIDFTPQRDALDALRVKREMSRWVMMTFRMLRRDMDMTGAFDAFTESQLANGDKRKERSESWCSGNSLLAGHDTDYGVPTVLADDIYIGTG